MFRGLGPSESVLSLTKARSMSFLKDGKRPLRAEQPSRSPPPASRQHPAGGPRRARRYARGEVELCPRDSASPPAAAGLVRLSARSDPDGVDGPPENAQFARGCPPSSTRPGPPRNRSGPRGAAQGPSPVPHASARGRRWIAGAAGATTVVTHPGPPGRRVPGSPSGKNGYPCRERVLMFGGALAGVAEWQTQGT